MWKAMRRTQPPAQGLASGCVVDGPVLKLVPPTTLLGEALQPRLQAMRLESGMEEAEFNRLVLDPMRMCAQWVQQLPATPEDHHSEAGGLVRLAVECAGVAMRRADGKLFHAPGKGPAGGVRSDTAWRYAAVIAALFTAIGPAVGRWRVRSVDGERVWNPYMAGLDRWVEVCGGGGYRVGTARAGEGVGRRGAAAWLAARCLDGERLARLQDETIGALMDVLGGGESSVLGEIVQDARSAVIAEDRTRARQHPPRAQVPLDHQLLGAMRGLVRDCWNVNQPEGRLLLGPGGVYLQWAGAAEQILARWRADYQGDPGVGIEDLARLLGECGLVEAGPATVAVKMSGDGPTVPMTCVRLGDPSLFGIDLSGVSPVEVAETGDEPEPPHQPPPEYDYPQAQPAAGRKTATPDRPGGEPEPGTEPGTEPGIDTGAGSGAPSPATPDPGPHSASAHAGLGRYGELGKWLGQLAQKEGALVPVDDGLAVLYSALQEVVTPKRFLDQASLQGVLVDDRPRPAHPAGGGPKEPVIVLTARVARLLGYGNQTTEKAGHE